MVSLQASRLGFTISLILSPRSFTGREKNAFIGREKIEQTIAIKKFLFVSLVSGNERGADTSTADRQTRLITPQFHW